MVWQGCKICICNCSKSIVNDIFGVVFITFKIEFIFFFIQIYLLFFIFRKNRRVRPITQGMKKRMRDKEERINEVEQMIQFSYLTRVSKFIYTK